MEATNQNWKIPFIVGVIILLIIAAAIIYWLITRNKGGGSTCTNNEVPSVDAPGVNGATFPPIPGIGSNIPSLPSQNYRVVFRNDTPETILLGVIGPTQLMPNTGTWVMKSGDQNYIDIPQAWHGKGLTPGPRFWARTGCLYDESSGYAECTTGDCNLAYNCNTSNIAGSAPLSLAEWTFSGPGSTYTYYDVSLVDGYNVSINIQPLNTGNNPGQDDRYWGMTAGSCGACKSLLGANASQTTCPPRFQYNKTLPLGLATLAGKGEENAPMLAGCFSNCGLMEYPNTPHSDCVPDDTTEGKRCADWRRFCCQSHSYGNWTPAKPNGGPGQCSTDSECPSGGKCDTVNGGICGPWHCSTDSDCNVNGFDEGGVCYATKDSSGKDIKMCQCRAYYEGGSCASDVCTNQTNGVPDPALDYCDNETKCVGDDTIHEVCPRAYTWPNDPQTYNSDATIYLVTFLSPPDYNLPPSAKGFPGKCSELPSDKYDLVKGDVCQSQAPASGPDYVCATPKASSDLWECNVGLGKKCGYLNDPAFAGQIGVRCQLDPIDPSSLPECSSMDESIYDTSTQYDVNCKGVVGDYACAIPKTATNPNWSCNVPLNIPCPNEAGAVRCKK
jgi:hypothetical protein